MSIAAFLIIFSMGFIHIITGVESKLGLPYDIAMKQSFGYKETIVNARKITSVPYVTAKIKYPIGCEVLQRLGYIDSGLVFETVMKESLLSKFKSWQTEFRKSIDNTERRWSDKLIGETENIDRNSKDADSYNNRGVIAAKQNRFETALSEFSKAINKNPTYDAYYNRALVYVTLGHLENAIKDFTKVIEIQPKFTDGYMERGQIYLTRGEYKPAITDFTNVIEIEPERAEAYFNRLLAYFALGEYDKAWNDVRKIETTGQAIPDEFFFMLRQVSNRQE